MSEEKKAFELAQDITTEQMEAVFFDADILRVPDYKLYQLNSRGTRYYYFINKEGKAEFFPSVTTILSEVSPRNPFLEKWRADMGLEKAEAYTQERAYYGTFMHGQIESLLINRSYNLDGLRDNLLEYMEREKLPSTFVNYAEDLKKDILSFAQFAKEYGVVPLCIEKSLYSPNGGYAGCLDLVASIYKHQHVEGKEAKNDDRIIGMIDFKSGRNGFHESHVHQLFMYKDMWLENFPDTPIDSIFNWSPKDWRKSPTYNFKCQDDAFDPRITATLLEQYKLRKTEVKDVTLVSGVITLDGGDIANNYRTISLDELVKERQSEVEEAEEDTKPLFEE